MKNVVALAILANPSASTWAISFANGDAKTGVIRHIADDVYKVTVGVADFYFDAAHVAHMRSIQ